MAVNQTVYKGEAGSVKFTADDSSLVAVASVRSFTIDQETASIETTAMGDTARTYIGGLEQFSGTIDALFVDGNEGHKALFDSIGNDTATAIELFPSGESTGIKLSGNVIITGHSITTNFDGLTEASITFQGSGALTKTEL